MKSLLLVLGTLFVCTCAIADDGGASPVGRRITDFALQDTLGAKHSLHDWDDKRAIVVVFLGTFLTLVTTESELHQTRA